MRLVTAICLFVGVLAINLYFFGDSLDQWIAGDEGLRWLKNQGPWAGIVGAGLIVSDLFLPMPISGVMAGLGQIYGGLIGGVFAAIGSVAGGLVAYGLTRATGRSGAKFIAGEENLVRLRRFFERNGAAAIALTRVLPVIPEVLCCLAGLTPMPFPKFFVALLCGSIPLSFLFAYFGSTAGEEPVTNVLIAIIVPALLFPPAWLLISRRSSAAETPG
jgi:uncharacterized membrane protein YdjX (TVP38/TMEM64 family)